MAHTDPAASHPIQENLAAMSSGIIPTTKSACTDPLRKMCPMLGPLIKTARKIPVNGFLCFSSLIFSAMEAVRDASRLDFAVVLGIKGLINMDDRDNENSCHL